MSLTKSGRKGGAKVGSAKLGPVKLGGRTLALVASLGLALLATQCGGGGSSNGGGGNTISVIISPASVTVNAGASQQFTATVTGATNMAVNWSATAGTISSAGLYTAPSPAPASGAATVTATSQADAAASASAKVTISFVCTPFPSAKAVTVRAGETSKGVDVAVPTLTPTLLISAVGENNSAGAATVSVAPGANASLLIVGQGMVAGTCFAISGPSDVQVTQPTTNDFFMCGPSGGAKNTPCAQVGITVSSTAAPGARNILVKNGAGEISAFVGGLLITRGP